MAMMLEAEVNGFELESLTELTPMLAEEESLAELPPGKYTLVGWDMQTTGKRLIDDISRIAVYTPERSYSQYIIAFNDLNSEPRRRHMDSVVTAGRYQKLNDTNSPTEIRTKSVMSVAVDFLDWLEKEKGDGSLILIYHELGLDHNAIMLLAALTRYELLDRFKSLVAGFVNCALVPNKCMAIFNSVTLQVLEQVQRDEETLSVDCTLERATAAYRIVEHLAEDVHGEVGAAGEDAKASNDMGEIARALARPVHTELEALSGIKKRLERQSMFRPVFAPLLELMHTERYRVTHLGDLINDSGLLYGQMRESWEDMQRAGLRKELSVLALSAKEKDINELIEIFDCHFDPAKVPIPLAPRQRARASSTDSN